MIRSTVIVSGVCMGLVMGTASCASLKARAFLKECQRDTSGFNEAKYYSTTPEELRAHLSSGIPLFYVGSSQEEDYFTYYYDAWDKILMGFRLPISERLQVERVPFAI